jgi:hypothetical protein
MGKMKRGFLITGIAVLAVIIAIIAFISPITKYLIEKYDKKFTGREISIDWAYVNPFTGYIHFSNLKINEFEKDTVFFSAKDLSVNICND